MDATKRTRVALRIISLLLLALLLAAAPVLIKTTVQNVFYLDDDSQETAIIYISILRWCHVAGIAALLALNLSFFAINEKKNDSGRCLRRRNALQGWLNFILVVIVVAAMILLRFQIYPYTMIDLFLSNAFYNVAVMLAPYYVFVICGVWLWSFAMRSVPATNCEVRGAIARKIDESIKRADKTR